MQNAVVTLVDLDACPQEFLVVGVLYGQRRARVAVRWQEQANIHAPLGCGHQAFFLLVRRDEVGSGDPDAAFRVTNRRYRGDVVAPFEFYRAAPKDANHFISWRL